MGIWALSRPSSSSKLDRSRFWYTGEGWSRNHGKRFPFGTRPHAKRAVAMLCRTDVTIVRVA